MTRLIGRTSEIDHLNDALWSNKSELIAIYGRRRVGKTFLIREHFKKQLVFEVSGLFEGNMDDQLENFAREISLRSKGKDIEIPITWMEAFTLLERYINSLKSKKRKVIFIDEFPWIATARSKFLMIFEHFWNSYCTRRDDLIVVICGSAASYMVQKIIKNKGGLHNRISHKIRLLPFNLYETQQFLKNRGISYTNYDIVQVYMAIGGVPHYLDKLQKGRSVAQNIDQLCFDKDGALNNEFNQLYTSLFDDSQRHMTIIRTLSGSNTGMTRNELILKSGMPSGGDFSLKLEELIESGFVSEYGYYQNKTQLSLYRLSDEYSKFYLKFIESNRAGGMGTWQRLSTSQSYKTWSGFTFETLCLKHIRQIKKALHIGGIYSTNSSWFNASAQIDLLIDRDDNVINLCEMKFYNAPYTIDKRTYLNLKNKRTEFRKDTNTKKNTFITLITTYGINENKYSNEIVQNSLKIDNLFDS